MSKNEILSIANVSLETSYGAKTPNENGEYSVIFGAFNVMSENGHFYIISDNVREMFADNSNLQRRVKSGELLSEVGHPPYLPGMTVADYLDSLLITNEEKVCGMITELSIDETPTIVTGQSQPVYLVRGKIKPHGPRAATLENSLISEDKNTAFSVRGLNHSKTISGLLYKEIHTIKTYDFVSRPGIKVAAKSEWSRFSLESLREIEISDTDKVIIMNRLSEREDIATESEALLIKEIKSKLSGCDSEKCVFKVWS